MAYSWPMRPSTSSQAGENFCASLATQVATPRYWFGDAGDIMPELIAVTLNIRLVILNPDGSATNVGAGGTQYPLIRFNPQGGEHYHGTRPNPEGQPVQV
jgi:hypothetical protein